MVFHIKGKRIDKRNITIAALFLTGIFHWYLFRNYGSPTFTFGDNPFASQIFDVLKQALQTGQIPYHATLFASETLEHTLYGTSRFLSMPWIIMPPLMFLLLFLNISAVFTAQYILYFTISFVGILKWTRKLNLTHYSTLFLLIVFSFNGALVSKAASGQLTTWGYMLIPWFLWIIYKFIENNNPSSFENLMMMLEFSFLLFFLLLNGDMHNFYQFVIVGFCVLVFYPGRILRFAGGVFIGVILSAWYFVPVLLFSKYTSSNLFLEEHWRHSGIYGYGSQNGDSGIPLVNLGEDVVMKILQWSINLLNHIWESLTYSFNASHVNVHEYNLYVSYLGVLLIVGSLIPVIFKYKPMRKGHLKQYRFLFGAIVVFLLAIGPFNYYLIRFLQSFYSFNPIDAIPSRLMIYPFSMTLLISSLGFDSMFKIFPKNIRPWFKWVTLLALLAVLMVHSYNWWFINSQVLHHDQFHGDFRTKIYDIKNDVFYKNVVNISYLSSLIIVPCVGLIYIRLKHYVDNEKVISLDR